MTLITDVLDPGAHTELLGNQGGVGRLLGLSAGGGTMLRNTKKNLILVRFS